MFIDRVENARIIQIPKISEKKTFSQEKSIWKSKNTIGNRLTYYLCKSYPRSNQNKCAINRYTLYQIIHFDINKKKLHKKEF